MRAMYPFVLALGLVIGAGGMSAGCAFDSTGSGSGHDAGQAVPDASAGQQPGADAGPPPACGERPGPEAVDYASDVQPIFDRRCTDCHGSSGGLDLGSYEGLMAGGSRGASVTACDCASSILWRKLQPDPPFGDRMPRDGPPYLSDPEIALICAWIDQGAGASYDPDACAEPDPPACSECGDGICADGHDCASCPEDCGPCGDNGNGNGNGNGNADRTPPTFAGIASIDELEPDTCVLSFAPAQDDVTLPDEIAYEAYAALRGEPIDDTGQPVAIARGGDLEFDDGGLIMLVQLEPGERYDLLVRAVDEAGNRDDNEEVDDCDLR
jgi:hypothetical protein